MGEKIYLKMLASSSLSIFYMGEEAEALQAGVLFFSKNGVDFVRTEVRCVDAEGGVGLIYPAGQYPSVVSFYENNGMVASVAYERVPDGLPSSFEYYADGSLKSQRWFDGDGKLHRDGGLPAVVKYDRSGVVEHESWFDHGNISVFKEMVGNADRMK